MPYPKIASAILLLACLLHSVFAEQKYSSSALTPNKNYKHSKNQTIVDAIRTLSFPSTCSQFSGIRADGQCKYTNCDPIHGLGQNCFFCRDWCDNTCGPTKEKILKRFANFLLVEKISGVFDFGDFCCIHDHCYSSTFTKIQCDKAFHGQMRRQCKRKKWYDPRRYLCKRMANLYYIGVKYGGAKAYAEAQRNQKDHEKSSLCTT